MDGINKLILPFTILDWSQIEKTAHPGITGSAWWQTIQFPGLRIRLVEYPAGYLADHWCQQGHIVHCLEGELKTEMESGERYILKQGMSYIVSDKMSSHRSATGENVKLLIIDGEFLKSER